MRLPVFLTIFLLACCNASALAQHASWFAEDALVEVDPALIETLHARSTANALIMLGERADLTPAYAMSWLERGRFVHQALSAVADRSQAPIRQELSRQGIVHQAFWIDNLIAVEGLDLNGLQSLLQFREIERIILEPESFLIEPEQMDLTPMPPRAGRAPEPNLVQIGAPSVWSQGITGSGIVVANIDSGVRHTHQALIAQYRGNLGGGSFEHNFNWLDPDGGTTVPTDTNGHGTHVMGSIIGDDGGANQIGVAPDAQWIACRGCLTSSCPQTALLACAQWVAAPHPIGSPAGADPDLRPQVVNNSWGNCQQVYNNWYQGAVDAWHAAGVYPVFANGNAGNCGYANPPGLNTVGNPARYGNVTGVGSSGTSSGLYAPHSNWGPTDNPDTINAQPGWEDLKPQVVAPGVSIRSSVPSSDTAYQSAGWTGTSMSAPHVAGLLALMWEAAPCLIGNYAENETILEQTANPILYNDLGTGARSPNHATGWGEINAPAAVAAAASLCGSSGSIAGTVTDAGSGLPLAGVAVTAVQAAVTRSTVTDAQGQYSIDLVPEGSNDVTASRFAYLTVVESGVQIVEGETTFLDFSLQQAPTHVVSGVVSDINTGWPLYARIDIVDVPDSPFFTDPVTGAYAISLPAGASYAFTVTSLIDGYLSDNATVGPLNSDLTVDWALDVNAALCTAPGYAPDDASGSFFDFELNDGGFVGTGSWEWGTDFSWTGAGCDGVSYPPPGAFSGLGMWATTLNGCHPNSGAFSNLSITVDLSGLSAALLQWWDWYDVFETFDFGEVYVNDTLVYDRASSYVIPTAWEQHSVDISAFAGGPVTVEFRMFATTVVNRAGWYIDDVLIGEPSCQPASGGLIVGQVRDANTGLPLQGATVSTSEAAAGSDADGFFVLFAEPGPVAVEASMPGGYAAGSDIASVSDGGTTGLDFELDAGALSIQPKQISITMIQGESQLIPLAFANQGAVSLDFSLTAPLLREDFEGEFAPVGWSVIDNGGNCVWRRNDQVPSGRPNYAGGEGFSAAADSDRCGSGTTMNTELRSPVLDLSAATTAALDFVASYRHLGASIFRVRVSGDGGDNWDTLLTWTASVDPTGPGTAVSLDLTPYAGSDAVLISFHYEAPAWHYWAQVDQIRVLSDAGGWLSVSPTSATIPGNTETQVDVAIDSTALAVGDYLSFILVDEDTPYPVEPIPVWLRLVTADELFEDRFQPQP